MLKRKLITLLSLASVVSLFCKQPVIEEITPYGPSNFQELVADPTTFDTIRLNIFIHGTYGAEATWLNIYKAFYDHDLSGSTHERVVRHFFRQRVRCLYDCSLMYDEGFFRINPMQQADLPEQQGLAIFPILSAFAITSKFADVCADKVAQIQDFYYTFGWGGLLSLDARRNAGLALFNAITTEKSALAAFLANTGAEKKIEVRLFCHSHGGNVALNLGWVDGLLTDGGAAVDEVYKELGKGDIGSKNRRQFESLIATLLPRDLQQQATSNYGMDKWLYTPVGKTAEDRLIDKLYLLATPIQDETWPLAFSPTFGNTVSFYSGADNVQTSDFVSTHNRKSERSIDAPLVRLGNVLFPNKDGSCRVVQVRVLLPKEDALAVAALAEESSASLRGLKAKVKSMLSNTAVPGPSHLEFWLLSWEGLSNRLCCRPAPLVSIIPLLREPWNCKCESLEIQFEPLDGGLSLIVWGKDGKQDQTLSSVLPEKLYKQALAEFTLRRPALEQGACVDKTDSLANTANSISRMALFLATS